MVGKYIIKTTRQSWDEVSMQQAIDAVNGGEMGWLRAAKTFRVPQATLRRRAKNKNKQIKGVEKGLRRFQSTFVREIEHELVSHLQQLESRLFGMTCIDVMHLAYQIAEQNNIPHRFSHEKKGAGWDWLKRFRMRNPEIALRKPEPTSAARTMGFTKPQVANFFKVYEDIVLSEEISPTRIYNIDESSLYNAKNPQNVFTTEKKNNAERGMHVTMVVCMNTTGNFVPPALIFPRKNWKNELTDGAPLGTLGIAHESGWMTGEIFVKWLEHLTHCTHRLQPMDVACYGPMKTYYNQEVSKWLKTHPGRAVTDVSNAKSGSNNTGLWTLNPDVFEEHPFATAETTDRQMIQESSQNMPDRGELQECQSQSVSVPTQSEFQTQTRRQPRFGALPGTQHTSSSSVSDFSNPFGILLIKKAKNSSEFIRSPEQQPNDEAATEEDD
ncbi:hypothetical protein PR048_027587 [Dryococelus australis]|uniref:HTH psq-type domain-containing protein n=1 Tax=Dryococelus australis TaxID=614101 RepID=A0ABQ9GGX8_9NEOP|nr:hypothetical protein PR048_027587 [Dryococelus australis]